MDKCPFHSFIYPWGKINFVGSKKILSADTDPSNEYPSGRDCLFTRVRTQTPIYLKVANRGDCKESVDTVDQPLPRVENPSTEAVNRCVHHLQII